jgi:hypothetical protein
MSFPVRHRDLRRRGYCEACGQRWQYIRMWSMSLSTAHTSVAVIRVSRLRRHTKWCKTPCIPPLGQNCEYLLIIMCRARRIEYAQFTRSRCRKVKANGIDAQSIPSRRWRTRHDTSTTPQWQTRLTVIHHFLRARKTRRHRARALSYATLRRQELSRNKAACERTHRQV